MQKTLAYIVISSLYAMAISGCGSSGKSSSGTNNTGNYTKAYYENIDYSNIKILSDKFLDRAKGFVDFNTKITLDNVIVETHDSTFRITSCTEKAGQYETYSCNSPGIQLTLKLLDDDTVNITATNDPTGLHYDVNFTSSETTTTTDTYGSDIHTFTSPDFKVTLPVTALSHGSATFEYNKTDNFVLIKDGDLGFKAFNTLVDITQNYPLITEVRFKNIDGSVSDEINMQTGLLIRQAELNTVVIPTDGSTTDIASGGVDLFTAGVERNVNNAKLGVHSWEGQGKEAREFPPTDKAHHDQLLYFCKMLGVDNGYDFYFYTIYVAAASDIYILMESDIQRYNLEVKKP